jgi:5-dehydro-4-deoxyglucarate dehydratase
VIGGAVGTAVELAKRFVCRADGTSPPYLMVRVAGRPVDHIEAVCKAISIGVIVYNRDNAG